MPKNPLQNSIADVQIDPNTGAERYRLKNQIGHILRRANQRHAAIFAKNIIEDLTPTRLATLAMLLERGTLSQNELGRLTAMDVATIKGVVDRLAKKELLSIRPDPGDARRNLIELTESGRDLIIRAIPVAFEISKKTTSPLSPQEQDMLIGLLERIT